MKLGIGLQRHQLDLEHYRFARQCGCTHLVLHLADDDGPAPGQVREEPLAAGYTERTSGDGRDDSWTYDALSRLTEEANAADLQVEAVDNADSTLCLDALLRSRDRARRIERLKTIIRNVGTAGIPVFIYHLFSPGKSGETHGRFARGDAETVGRDLPPGEARRGDGLRVPSTRTWSHLQACLAELLPVAEEAGVTLAAQAHEPAISGPRRPLPTAVRPGTCEHLIDLHPSARHGLVFSVAELAAAGESVYAALTVCSQQRRIACVRLGNGTAGATRFHETFVDDGDVDMLRIIRILQGNDYGGLIVPGRIPRMNCAAPWHAGVAHTLGYLKAALPSPHLAE